METIAVERSVWIAVPPERAWRAVTEPEQLNQWYATGRGYSMSVENLKAYLEGRSMPH
ncbi:MAG: SRPBCC domain-containing protein [Chloroflexi bacterium]|nr:SRPBCC domain-containing protein [Chloroflexota bacterium]MCI0581250.1 SRPBCC domain-containing protein [Chloroflexota bacterium]MCI0728061.1 SRPBCC domain-containing protein [Chloroflexota bacterium]